MLQFREAKNKSTKQNLKIRKHLHITFAHKYRRKKSSRKDLPFLKAPATDTTATFLSCIRGSRSIPSNFSSSNMNWWSSAATTICTGCPDRGVPLAETVHINMSIL